MHRYICINNIIYGLIFCVHIYVYTLYPCMRLYGHTVTYCILLHNMLATIFDDICLRINRFVRGGATETEPPDPQWATSAAVGSGAARTAMGHRRRCRRAQGWAWTGFIYLISPNIKPNITYYYSNIASFSYTETL